MSRQAVRASHQDPATRIQLQRSTRRSSSHHDSAPEPIPPPAHGAQAPKSGLSHRSPAGLPLPALRPRSQAWLATLNSSDPDRSWPDPLEPDLPAPDPHVCGLPSAAAMSIASGLPICLARPIRLAQSIRLAWPAGPAGQIGAAGQTGAPAQNGAAPPLPQATTIGSAACFGPAGQPFPTAVPSSAGQSCQALTICLCPVL